MNAEKKKFKLREYLPIGCMIIFLITLAAAIVEIVSRNNMALADAINDGSGRIIRFILAKATSWIPFSFAETIIICSPVIIGILVYLMLKAGKRSLKALIRVAAVILSIVAVVYSTFVFGYGTGYYGKKIDQKLNMKRADLTAEELYDTAMLLLDGAIAELDNINFPEGTCSKMPYSYTEFNRELNKAWDKVCEKYPGVFQHFYSNTKPVLLSEPWSYTQIAGVYSFFTGEANVNVNYPDFIIATSAAHEMSHQRGVGREDEANFVSFLVCINSDDAYLRYSGYLDMYREVRDKLKGTDKELYNDLVSHVPDEIIGELNDFAVKFAKYAKKENVVAKVSDKINDTYITIHGQEAGSKSYGLVVDLLCAYMLYGDGAAK
ncbi:MAG: DUF3810 domain-containing protein [Clostridia bacterium]|nr:DUF3810 domain-containing protein [Clostridia bacterium]